MYIAAEKWQSPYYRSLNLTLLLITISSLGPIMHLAGVPISTSIWTLLYHIPLIRYALPERFMMYSWLIIAVLIASWLSIENSILKKYLKYLVVFLGLLMIFPNTSIYDSWSSYTIPKIYSSREVCSITLPTQNILILPFGLSGNNMAYQIQSNMCFKMPEGYTGSVPYPFTLWPLVNTLTKGEYSLIDPKNLANYISNYHIYSIFLPKNIFQKKILEDKLVLAGMRRAMVFGSTIVFKRTSKFNVPPLTLNDIKLINLKSHHLWEKDNADHNRIIIKEISRSLSISQDGPQSIYSWLIAHKLAH